MVVELQGRSVAFMQSPKPVNIISEAPFLILSHTTGESVPCPTCVLIFFLPLHLLLPPPPSPLLPSSPPFSSAGLSVLAVCPLTRAAAHHLKHQDS